MIEYKGFEIHELYEWQMLVIGINYFWIDEEELIHYCETLEQCEQRIDKHIEKLNEKRK